MPKLSRAQHDIRSLKAVAARLREAARRTDDLVDAMERENIAKIVLVYQQDLLAGMRQIESWAEGAHRALRDVFTLMGVFEAGEPERPAVESAEYGALPPKVERPRAKDERLAARRRRERLAAGPTGGGKKSQKPR